MPPDIELDVVILGAGLSGIAMGAALRRSGRQDFLILESATAVGGTWWHNQYPGAQCDVPSHLYSYSFAPNPNWSRVYAPGAEIQQYAQDCVTRFGLEPHLRLGRRIESAVFDDSTQRWRITASDGSRLCARHFVVSMGPLNRPQRPIGIDHFSGPVLHTADWDSRVDLRNKRVALIGTAASAIQVLPAIVRQCAHVDVYQRTPSWIVPRGDHPYSERTQRLLRNPALWRIYRECLHLQAEAIFPAFRRVGLMHRLMSSVAKRHLASSVKDPALRRRLTPTYPIGCKRILLSDDYYPAIQQPHVTLHPAAETFSANGVVDIDGCHTTADVILCATGFDTLHPLGSLAIQCGDNTLEARWANGPEAYRGTTVDGFPNLWFLLGPNTGTGHTSVLIPIEAQVRYVIKCLEEMDKRGARAMRIRPQALQAYNQELQRKMTATVWADRRCNSWYKTDDGRVLGTFPGFITQFSRSMRRPRYADYIFT